MAYTTDEEIINLVNRFENCTVPRTEWTHAAHLTVALWYAVRHRNLDMAVAKMRDGIFKLLSAFEIDLTKEMPYHETLTVFWMQTVFDYLEKTADQNSLVTRANGLIETCGDSGFPLKFYSRELLFSPAARAKYLKPNLKNHA